MAKVGGTRLNEGVSSGGSTKRRWYEGGGRGGQEQSRVSKKQREMIKFLGGTVEKEEVIDVGGVVGGVQPLGIGR
jgi:hypothetical protein